MFFEEESPDRQRARAQRMDRLMQSLGYVLFHWTQLERAFLDDIRRLRKADGDSGEAAIRARGSFSERLAEWRALMSLRSRRNPVAAREVGDLASTAERLRRQRMLIGQHFSGAEPAANGELTIYVSEGGLNSIRSSQQQYTQSELDQLIAEMDSCRDRLRSLEELLAPA